MELAVSLKCTVRITRPVALMKSGSGAEVSQRGQYGKSVRIQKKQGPWDTLTGICSRRWRFWVRRSCFCSKSWPVQWNTQRTAGSVAVSLVWQFTVYIVATLLLPHTTYTSRSRWYEENRNRNPIAVCFRDDGASLWPWCNYLAVGSVFHFILRLNYSK